MTFEVKVQGLDELIQGAQRAGANVRPLVTTFLRNVTGHIQNEARQRAPHRTGNLQRHILQQINYPNADVHVQESYGLYVERGTGIYGPYHTPIVPTSKKALAFKVGGVSIVRRSVKGMKARPFFEPAIKESMSFLDQQLQSLGDTLTRIIASKQ